MERIYNGLTPNEVRFLRKKWYVQVSRYCLKWEEARDFILWAQDAGYIDGAKLRRHFEAEPYSPDNCYWEITPRCFPEGHPCRDCVDRQGCEAACPNRLRYWDAFVERVREADGGVQHEHAT